MAFVLWGQLRLIILSFLFYFLMVRKSVCFNSNYLHNCSINHLFVVGGKQRTVKESMQTLFAIILS